MDNVIEIQHLKKYFKTPRGMLHAVDDVSLSIERGKTVGVVGESGCGKSTLGRTMIRLLDSTGGNIIFNGEDITDISGAKLKNTREKMQIIFQDPYSSLNPRKTARETIEEVLKISKKYSKKEIEERSNDIMQLVGIDRRIKNSYPHELDGGRRQRIGIARALALNPELVICDEPVSALDVSIQAQVLNLLQDLQDQLKLTYVFITHDLSVVRYLSNDICVMYLGQVVEFCNTKELFNMQLHPYTKALLSAIPVPDIHVQMKREILHGEVVSPIDPKPGCRFAARCKYATDACKEPQTLKEVTPGHFVSCCRVDEIN
ncbi:MAG: ABC transporter ATP-binding protein [Oscillospiraceae bacterium]